MSMKNHDTLRHVRWQDFSVVLLERLGFDFQKDKDKCFTLRVEIEDIQRNKKAPYSQVMETIKRLQALPVINPDVTEDSLYDEHGLPK